MPRSPAPIEAQRRADAGSENRRQEASAKMNMIAPKKKNHATNDHPRLYWT
jgi:hypothetical protein